MRPQNNLKEYLKNTRILFRRNFSIINVLGFLYVTMMDSCFHNNLEPVEAVNFDDLKKDLFSEFHSLDTEGICLEEPEHLQVYLRVRPFTSSEHENGESQDCVSIEPPDTVLLKAPRTSLSARLSDKTVPQTALRFRFSRVLGPETSQKEMFDSTVRSLVKEVLEGGNSLVFTYGVTNAGKTFTFLGPEANAGILPRSLNVIFSSIEGRVHNQMTIKPQRCREFTRLTKDQQNEEATSKRNLFRLLKEVDHQKSNLSQASLMGKTTLEGSTLSAGEVPVPEDSISLDVEEHTRFSVWVSFCEIYNENIHDLLEPIPNGALKRTTLRLAQDIKGNSFIKDLKWVQVNHAEEAYRVMKLGKKNQSFASTKLNLLSSRSHSIFSIRILRIEDSRIPRVNCISELLLCDLAGSERCAKTQNKGERLKEAGNINTSLMTLGKCINALRQSQQSKLPQHIPFRESKLTHHLQGFFSGRGKACMIVNINQCASMFDETLNVLKFSAVAQKVVMLTTKTLPPLVTKRSARELSMIINNADLKVPLSQSRRSSLVAWENSLEDVQEDYDDDEEDSMSEESEMDESMNEEDDDKVLIGKETYERQLGQLNELQKLVDKLRSENLVQESRIREEVTKEFSDLFSEMQTDYDGRLEKEKEIAEKRAETRLMILKNLMTKSTGQDDPDGSEQAVDNSLSFGEMFDSVCSDLASIKTVAEAAKTCLVVADPSSETLSSLEERVADLSSLLSQTQDQLSVKVNELGNYCRQAQQLKEQLEEERKTADSLEQKFSHLMEKCHEKDLVISRLQASMDQQAQATLEDKLSLCLKSSCVCARGEKASSRWESRKRAVDVQLDEDVQPPSKKGFHEGYRGEEEMKSLHSELEEVNSSKLVRLEETSTESDRPACRDSNCEMQEGLECCENKSTSKEVRVQVPKADLEVPTLAHKEALCTGEKVRREAAWPDDVEQEIVSVGGESLELTANLEALEGKVSLQTSRADQASGEFRTDENTQIASLKQELTCFKQGVEPYRAVSGVESNIGRLQNSETLEESQKRHQQIQKLTRKLPQQQTLEQELVDLKLKLAQQQILEQELVELKLKLAQQQIVEQELGDLKQKLAQQHFLEQELEELKQKLSQQQILEQELGDLKQKWSQQQILEQELGELKQKLAQQQFLEQELGDLKQKLAQQQILEQELGELKQKLAQQQILEQELGELKQKLSQQQILEQELGELKQKVAQQQFLEQELGDLKQKLSQQQILEQELGELKQKLAQQNQAFDRELDDLRQKLAQQELTVIQLREEMKEAKSKDNHIASERLSSERATAQGLRKLNSDLEAEVATLKETLADLETERTCHSEREAAVTVSLTYKDELMAQTERVAELEKKLSEEEVLMSGLQRSLREAQENREEGEMVAVQVARRREVERRRELLAVAEEAIAQKDAELEKRAQDIIRLKESAKMDSDKVKSLSLDLQRKEDDTSDLKEKLADAKKQIQQVQKEISSMREDNKTLKQKLLDMEKIKKQQHVELANKDRTINLMKTEQSTDSKSDEILKLYQNVCKDLQVKDGVMENMRLALAEQEETQTEQDRALEAKMEEIQALTDEVEKLKGLLLNQEGGKELTDSQSDDSKQEALQAQVALKLCTEKHQTDRKKWLEEKMVLIGQAKEAENKRNQEMRRYADDRERHAKQQSQVDALTAQLSEREQDLEKWRKERDTLVAALEVQLTKLLASSADKDQQIASLRCTAASQPAESALCQVKELQSLLSERDKEILNLREQLRAASLASARGSALPSATHRETATPAEDNCPPTGCEPTLQDGRTLLRRSQKRSSQGSGGYPSVLESSEISMEGGRTSRFPKPELEISFSPLQPNRMLLKRQGEDVVNVKINRSARKRKSAEIDKEEVVNQNVRNTRTRLAPQLAAHQEEQSPARGSKDSGPMMHQGSRSSLRARKDGAMQKIGDFLQSSPTFFGTKAKKIMGLVSGKSPEAPLGSSMSSRPKKPKRTLYRPDISSPMDFPSHTMITPDEKESDHLIIKRKLRTRTAK
ncbi:hypothetical protein UPYG_G00131980 [Umbra pygmaea]|uniref:Kinesin motor domain-containing protein n=1 Tax=Umbra pygmaea TaxID=75934 RepID=A0ABD0WTA0_UMBPY